MTDLATARPALFSRPLPILIFIVIAVILDQIVKIAVDHYLPLQEAVPVIPMLALYRTYNLGVAFSMLSGMDGWFIVGMRLIIVAFVLYLWHRTAKALSLASHGQGPLAGASRLRADHCRSDRQSHRPFRLWPCDRLYPLPHGNLVLRRVQSRRQFYHRWRRLRHCR